MERAQATVSQGRVVKRSKGVTRPWQGGVALQGCRPNRAPPAEDLNHCQALYSLCYRFVICFVALRALLGHKQTPRHGKSGLECSRWRQKPEGWG